jgi:hypothetical protein
MKKGRAGGARYGEALKEFPGESRWTWSSFRGHGPAARIFPLERRILVSEAVSYLRKSYMKPLIQ